MGAACSCGGADEPAVLPSVKKDASEKPTVKFEERPDTSLASGTKTFQSSSQPTVHRVPIPSQTTSVKVEAKPFDPQTMETSSKPVPPLLKASI